MYVEPASRTRSQAAVTFCGIFLITLAVLCIALWHFTERNLPTFLPKHPPLKYSTSVAFAIAGSCLVLLRYRFNRASAVLAGVLGLVCTLLSIEYLMGISLGVGDFIARITTFAGRLKNAPSPPSTLCFALAGTVLALRGTSLNRRVLQILAWGASTFIFSLGCIALVGYATGLAGSYVWENFAGMSIYSAIGMCVLGFALLAAHLEPQGWRGLADDYWLALPVVIVTLTVSFILWQSVLAEQRNGLRARVTVVADDLETNSKNFLGSRIRALSRMARRWSNRGGTPFNEWTDEAQSFLDDEDIFLSIGRVDAISRLSWIHPENSKTLTIGEDLGIDSRWNAAAALKDARLGKEIVISPNIALQNGVAGILAYVPIYERGKFAGYIVGAIDSVKYCKLLLGEPGVMGYRVSVMQGAHLVYGYTLDPDSDEAETSSESKLSYEGLEWRFIVWPGPAIMAANSTKLPNLVFLIGILLASCLGLATYSLQKVKTVSKAQQKANRRLQETARAEEAARSLLETAGRMARLGHWELALDHQTLKWSDMTCEIHDLPHGTEMSLDEAVEFYRNGDRERIEGLLKRSVETGEPFDCEVQLVTAQGRHLWVHCQGKAETDSDGQVTLLRGVLQDVSESHKATEMLEDRNRKLEAATEEAQAHARAKAEFLANMSHEIRTPLNAIIGMSELLHDVTKDRRQVEFIETIRGSGDVLLSLINDILDFSKIEAGQLTLERAPIDLNECVESSLDLASPQASRKQLELLYWVEPAVPAFVYGDMTRLRQILVNLVSNGVKFTEGGQIYIRVSKVRDSGRDMIHFSVKDTGIGIPPDRQHRLFQAFSQVDASTNRRYGGTGLGLAICSRLVNIMGGRIWVDSEQDQGANFQFTMPLEEAPKDAASPSGSGEVRNLSGLRVLIVDDNETNRWILNEQTSRWSMQPRVTGKPSEALNWVSEGNHFDLAILDGHMPEMSGYELATQLRSLRTQQELSIIILTSMKDHSQDTSKLGISDLLTKPVKVTVLEQAIATALRRTPAPAKEGLPDLAPRLGEECPLKILVAEDNSVNQRVITLLLERLGYRPEIVANGLEVLTSLKRTQFDVILMDVQMPEMDGLEAAQEVCRRLAPANRPFMIALTANAGEGERQRCLDAGMDEYLSKPIRSVSLSAALRSAYTRITEGVSAAS